MIDINKRAQQAIEYKKSLRFPNWSVEQSTDDLKKLADLVHDHKNKKERLLAFEASSLSKERKSFFNDCLEPLVRKYVRAAKKDEIHGDLVRWAIGMGPNQNYSNLDEFDAAIDKCIEQMESARQYRLRRAMGTEIDTSFAETLGKIIGYGIFIIPAIFVVLLMAGFFEPSDSEIASSESQRIDQCLQSRSESISRSCESDPVFSYCSLNYDAADIIGSGCTTTVTNQGSHSMQVDYCKEKSLAGVRRSCAIEVYGCAAFTGDINCKP